MKTRFLFSHQWRKIGYTLFILSLAIDVFRDLYDFYNKVLFTRIAEFFNNNSIAYNDTIIIGAITGLLLIGFSKEKVEDEQIAHLRLESLQLAIYFNCIVLVIGTILVDGMDFISVLSYNMITPLLFFVICFKWKMFRLNRSLKEESLS